MAPSGAEGGAPGCLLSEVKQPRPPLVPREIRRLAADAKHHNKPALLSSKHRPEWFAIRSTL
jgi:hypothetical protein